MHLTFLRGTDGDADYNLDEVFIGPDDFPAQRVTIAVGGRPMGDDVVDAIEVSPTSLFKRAFLRGGLSVMRLLAPDMTEGDDIQSFARDDGLHPTTAQLERFFAREEAGAPYMLNLLAYDDWGAYQRYGVVAGRYVAHIGAEIVWSASCLDDGWDEAVMVRYPSREAFRTMATRRVYQQSASKHRTRGLARTRLYVLSPRSGSSPR